MSIEKETAPAREGEILGGGTRFAFREEGAGDGVVWLGAPSRNAVLKQLVAAQCRIVALVPPAGVALETPTLARGLGEAAAALGLERFSLVAEGAEAVPALLLALDEPQRVTSVILLAPQIFDAEGRALSVASETVASRLSAIEMPVLALFGTKDRSVPPEAARHYRARNPRCHLVFVYDAGKALGEERPEAVAELVADFVHRRDRFLVRQHEDRLYR